MFYDVEDPKDTLFCKIKSYQRCPSFDSMLDGRFQSFLPRARTLQRALEVYHSIPWFKEADKRAKGARRAVRFGAMTGYQ